MRNTWALDVGTCHTSRGYKDGSRKTEIKRNQGVAVGGNVSSRRRSRDSHPGPSLENGLLTSQHLRGESFYCIPSTRQWSPKR